MKKVALLLVVGALSVALVWMIWLANRPTAIERAVLSEAEAGAFPLEGDYTYDGQVECRVEDVEAFQGEDLFICRLGLNGVDAGGSMCTRRLWTAYFTRTRRTQRISRPGRSTQDSRVQFVHARPRHVR